MRIVIGDAGLKNVLRTQAFFFKPSRLNLTSFFHWLQKQTRIINLLELNFVFIESNVDCNGLSDCFPFLSSGSFVIGS